MDDLEARRDRLVWLCRTLPEATVTAHDQHVGFQVRGRTFAWYVDDEHGDGRVAVLCKAPPGENTALVATDPHRFYLPRYVGSRGWWGCASTARTSTGARSPSWSPTATGWSPPGGWPGWSINPSPELHCRGASPSRGFWLPSG